MRALGAIAAVGAASAALAGAAPRALVIHGDYRLGTFAVKRDGTLAGAIDAFGNPTTLRRDRRSGWGKACVAVWRPLRLRVFFYNLGGRDACRPADGHFRDALITGRQWRTAKGLRIGDSARRMRALYHPRRRTGAWSWLVTRRSPYGPGGSYAGLAAKVHRGRVVAFSVFYQAGGD